MPLDEVPIARIRVRYQLMRQAILSDIAPKSAIEWLLTVDVIELS
jgi:hypothetical protein